MLRDMLLEFAAKKVFLGFTGAAVLMVLAGVVLGYLVKTRVVQEKASVEA